MRRRRRDLTTMGVCVVCFAPIVLGIHWWSVCFMVGVGLLVALEGDLV